jgi:hypothetical protein
MEEGFGPLNIYSILDPCTFRPSRPSPLQQPARSRRLQQGGRVPTAAGGGLREARQRFGRAWPLTGVLPGQQELRNFGHVLRHTVACADRSAALLWFNSEAARAAIHAASSAEAGAWEPCSDVLHYRHDAGGWRLLRGWERAVRAPLLLPAGGVRAAACLARV